MPNIVFAKASDSQTKEIPERKKASWKIIISDDEEQVHEITRLALNYFQFEERELEFLSAFSAKETKRLIADNPDVAIILQDVVMETDTAGLDVVKFVREELDNQFVRIILRTGQPGQAPERKVIVDYDINDYKEKTELTSQKLFTLIYSSLRSFQNINMIERNKKGLQRIVDSSADLFSRQPIEQFLSATLTQITTLLYNDKNAFICDVTRLPMQVTINQINVISAMGDFADFVGENIVNELDDSVQALLQQSLDSKRNVYQPKACVFYFSRSRSNDNCVRLLYIKTTFELSEVDKNLVDLYLKQASVSFDNLMLYRKVETSQQEIVNLLGTSIETRSKETGNHIKRVAEISALLARYIGMNNDEIEILKLASPLHDLGKIGIPDAILNKPGKLSAEEWQMMKTHAQIGHDMLINSDCDVLLAGAIIAYEHHEKWNGSGYPLGKRGEAIHIYGRITAVADVFDALASERCYKNAWLMKDILSLFESQRGLHFEPELVDVLIQHKRKFMAILEQYKD